MSLRRGVSALPPVDDDHTTMQTATFGQRPRRSPGEEEMAIKMRDDPAIFDVRGAPSITVREASARLGSDEVEALLLDVREVYEFVPRHATGAANIPMSQLQRRVGEVPRDREVLVICEHGNRSVDVTRFLRAQGVSAVNVGGGTEEWEQARLPMEYPQS